MKLFKKLFIGMVLLTFFVNCNADNEKIEVENQSCTRCNMSLDSAHLHTAVIINKKGKKLFDDIGCMLIWSHENKIDLKTTQIELFSKDSKKYINSKKAHFTFNEETPMSYGFTAYEKHCDGCIDFNEVVNRMERGEHMANPKTRKHLLGH